MKFLEKHLICVDLSMVDNIEDFNKLSKKLNSYNIVLDDKVWDLRKDLGVQKVFLYKESLEIVFVELKINDQEYIGIYPYMSDELLGMKAFRSKKNMDVDSILERISKYGIKSLTKKEEKILKNSTK